MRYRIATTTVAALASLMLMSQTAGAQVSSSDDLPTYEQVGLTWARGPDVRDMERFYRTASRAYGALGTVEVSCTSRADGRLDCSVLDEYPDDLGLSNAALRVMARTRVAAVDGHSPEGRTFGYRLRFGNWSSGILPDRFQPIEQGFRWRQRPEMSGWSGSGLGVGQVFSASFTCRVLSGGNLDCTPTSNDGNDQFLRAATASMNSASVTRVDGGRMEGSQLEWTLRVQRQSHCGGGGTPHGRPDEGRGAMVIQNPNQGDPLGALTSEGGSAPSGQGQGSCLGAIIQLH